MTAECEYPTVLRILDGQASEIRYTPYGAVGTVYSGHYIEAVWVRKQDEAVDPDWFSQMAVDLILVLEGLLRVEFADPSFAALTLQPGEVLILPPGMRCQGYRWPRDAVQPTIFFAAYPKSQDPGHA